MYNSNYVYLSLVTKNEGEREGRLGPKGFRPRNFSVRNFPSFLLETTNTLPSFLWVFLGIAFTPWC
jgi:hypothetical protein